MRRRAFIAPRAAGPRICPGAGESRAHRLSRSDACRKRCAARAHQPEPLRRAAIEQDMPGSAGIYLQPKRLAPHLCLDEEVGLRVENRLVDGVRACGGRCAAGNQDRSRGETGDACETRDLPTHRMILALNLPLSRPLDTMG